MYVFCHSILVRPMALTDKEDYESTTTVSTATVCELLEIKKVRKGVATVAENLMVNTEKKVDLEDQLSG